MAAAYDKGERLRSLLFSAEAADKRGDLVEAQVRLELDFLRA
jgi:hypothetical protein